MNYTNEYLQEMDKRINITNKKFMKYYYRLYKETGLDRFLSKSRNIGSCRTYWRWDVYDLNKRMELQQVITCKDSKFCPNCRDITTAYAIHNFRPAFREMLCRGYVPLFITLTVPNITGVDLKDTLSKMGKKFSKLWEWYNRPLKDNCKGTTLRYMEFKAAIRCLEVNVQKTDNNYYHPHYHCIVFVDRNDYLDNEELFVKDIPGPYRNKSKDYIKYSEFDMQIMKFWRMAFEDIRLTSKSYESYSENWWDLYQCDVRVFDMHNQNSIYEIFKYPFKDKDLNFYNFRDLQTALDGKRLRQGHGELYNLDLEKECGEVQELILEIEESPRELVHKEIGLLYKDYHDYVKISRFQAAEDFDMIRKMC